MYKTKLEYNSLDLIPVGMLLHQEQSEWLRFYVPAYQRGYRWSAEQVEQLIDDLIEFKTRKENNSQAFYCLQPLVVKPVNQDGIESLEVIDGQQRLTTILIILQVLRQLQYEEERDEDTQPYFSRLLKMPTTLNMKHEAIVLSGYPNLVRPSFLMRHLRSLIIRIVIIVILQKFSRLHIIGLRGLTDLNLRPFLQITLISYGIYLPRGMTIMLRSSIDLMPVK